MYVGRINYLYIYVLEKILREICGYNDCMGFFFFIMIGVFFFYNDWGFFFLYVKIL